MSRTIRPEHAATVLGVSGRTVNLIAWPAPRREGEELTFMHQGFTASRPLKNGGRLTVEMRFDDNPRNGHNTFAITATENDKHGRDVAFGCMHEEIARKFPEFAHLIKWHLVSTDGPMHYLANTAYFAGNRDHSGRRAGEASSWQTAIQFGDNPIKHHVRPKFWKFLKEAAAHPGRERFDFEVIGIDHKDRKTFGTHYTFGGYGEAWHDCPFTTESQALDFLAALQRCDPQFLQIPVAWSEGKARELDKARNAAVWPDATDEQLSVEPEELKAALLARLPGLLEEFRADMAACGFHWTVDEAQAAARHAARVAAVQAENGEA